MLLIIDTSGIRINRMKIIIDIEDYKSNLRKELKDDNKYRQKDLFHFGQRLWRYLQMTGRENEMGEFMSDSELENILNHIRAKNELINSDLFGNKS